MEGIQTFHTEVKRGYQGAIAYHCLLPNHTKKLHIQLTYNKQFIADIDTYKKQYASSLLPILETYLAHTPTDEEYDTFVKHMKTEIQLCAYLDGTFIGNVHRPGLIKEMTFTNTTATTGCIVPSHLSGVLTVIINVFQVVEENTYIDLKIEGESYVEEN